jgi:hypothetical protein
MEINHKGVTDVRIMHFGLIYSTRSHLVNSMSLSNRPDLICEFWRHDKVYEPISLYAVHGTKEKKTRTAKGKVIDKETKMAKRYQTA